MPPPPLEPDGQEPSRSRWLGEIVDRYGPGLALYAAQWTADEDDCVQEALLALAWQDPRPESPAAWLYTVVRRRAINQARGERRRRERAELGWQERLRFRGADAGPRDLLDAVGELPRDHREAVLLKTWGGLTFAEIAEVLDLSSSSVHRRYHEALDRLRKEWEAPCPNESSPP